MPTKLTLRLDEALIAAAKTYARTHGRSVSVLVADYFANLTQQPQPGNAVAAPEVPIRKITASLRGVLQSEHAKNLDVADYQRHLETKYK